VPVVGFVAEPLMLPEVEEPEAPLGLAGIDDVPEPPAGGVAVELRGVVEVPEVPEVLVPALSSQPTRASAPRTAPARSVRLSIEALLPQYSRSDGRRSRADAVMRIRERWSGTGIPWQCSDKRDGFPAEM
jgi:hypothetical protein